MLRIILILILALFFHSMDVTVVSATVVLQNTKPTPPKAPTKSIPAPKKQITPKKKTTLRSKIESLERVDSIKKARLIIDSIKIADSLQKIDSVKKHVSAKLQTDSLQAFLTDTSRITDTLSKRAGSDLDTVVTYYARDTVMFSLSKKSMRLRGQSRAIFKEQKLEAEVIEFDFNASTMQANAAADSSGRFSGYPKFTDRGEEFVGEKLLFNFQTKRGTITLGETKVQDGFYFGSKVKRVNENTLFIQNGCYTTCSQPHPHFYFGSPEMKVITNDRIFINPLVVYVEDMPVFALPFGLYFENKTGRRSGIIIPSFFFSNLNGVTFQNLGYYFALSDYYDTQFSADIFSKTGYLLRNSTRYVYQKSLNGNFSLSFGRRSSSSDAELLNNWKIDFSHSQILTPQANLTANLSFSSQDFNRNFSTDLNQRIQQEISSYASIFQSFDNGTSLSGGFTRSQNIITGAYQTGGNASFSVPQIFPFKKLTQSDNWLGDIALTYSGRAGYTLAKAISKTDLDTVTNINTYTFSKNESYAINHNPSISISPKLGYFSITPSISYRENWFFRKRTKTINPIDSTVIDTYEHSVLPYRDYFYDFGLSVGTRIYGVFQPNLFGIKAMRHVFIPNVRFNYTPEYSAHTTDKIGQYTDLMSGDVIQYSHFDKDGGEGVRPKARQTLAFGALNTFQVKIAQADTMPDLNLDLFSFELNSAYDFNRDSLKLDDIQMTFRTPALTFLNINGSARFTAYDEGIYTSPNGNVKSPTRINQTLLSAGKGLVGLTFFGLSFSTSFSSEGVSLASANSTDTSSAFDSLSGTVGERFLRRINYTEKPADIFGDQTDGYSPFSIPWRMNMNLNFSYNQPFKHQITRRLDFSATIDFSMTQTWKVGTSLNYDFVGNQFNSPTVNITKDLDCFDLRFTWYPIGFSQGFYLRFGIKAPQLQDMKIEKRDLPGYR